jgi:hypothetical protein
MPLKYSIDKEQRLVVLTGTGNLTFDEVKEQQDRLLEDPDLNPDFDQLVDLTAVTVYAVTADEAVTLARRRVFSPASRRALVARDPATYGLARMMQTHRGIAKVQAEAGVFYDRKEALAWLGR